MKTEPTEARCHIMTRSFGNGYGDEIMEREDAEEAVDMAFREGQSSPKIKQLEWNKYENFRGRKSYFAKTPFSSYEVEDCGDHFIMFSPNKRLRFASVDEAKAAAQAEFERRVMDCLYYE